MQGWDWSKFHVSQSHTVVSNTWSFLWDEKTFSLVVYLTYRIAGNFRWSKFSQKFHFPSIRNFCGFNFCVQHELLTTLLYRRRESGDGRCPMREGRTSSAGLNRYSSIVRLTETSAQNAHVNISAYSKVHENFTVSLSQF